MKAMEKMREALSRALGKAPAPEDELAKICRLLEEAAEHEEEANRKLEEADMLITECEMVIHGMRLTRQNATRANESRSEAQ